MIVLDASVVLDLLLSTPAGSRVEQRIARDRSLHAPGVLDLEVMHSLRRLHVAGEVNATLARQVVTELAELPVRRYPHTPLLERVWELRSNLTAYDAAYVSLAEALDAPLLTRDARLGRASGHRAKVEVV